MTCVQIEELLPGYIENDLPPEIHQSVSDHLHDCPGCRELKAKIESMFSIMPDMEVEVPFLVRNRLYYIPESQQKEIKETKLYFLRWVAAAVGIFALCLNLFYFTNIYPPANQALHLLVSQIEKLAVKTEGFISRLSGSKDLVISAKDKKEPTVEIEEDKGEDSEGFNHLNGGENG